MKSVFITLCCFISFASFSQGHPTCDGSRYIDDVFTEVSVTNAIQFGEGETFAGNIQQLFLDVYEPVGDVITNRPVILLTFGGSFLGGSRDEVQWICEDYARKGFVTVAFDYRLYDGPLFPVPSADKMQEVVVKTLSDVKAAIRFMRESADNGNPYGIDPDWIFGGGISAGAIAVAHAAVVDETDDFSMEIQALIDENGGIEGNSSDNTHISSELAGILNFSGALNDVAWIDENDPVLISVHDDQDPVVPYGDGFATIFGIPIIDMKGSGVMHEVCNNLGIQNHLITIPGMGHVSYFISESTTVEIINETSLKLHNLMCSGVLANEELDSFEDISIYPNPTSGLVTIEGVNGLKGMTLYDVLGNRVQEFLPKTDVSLDGLNDGVYFLQIRDDYNNRITRPIQLLRK